jgi:hypothetical protein
MWVRIHKPPKKGRRNWDSPATARQRYYRGASYARYLKTDDGEYLNEAAKTMGLEIGRYDEMRFVKAPSLPSAIKGSIDECLKYLQQKNLNGIS